MNPELDDEFVDLIAAMMMKQPPERIQTMGEVVRRLSKWADPQSIAHAAAVDHLDAIAVQSIHPSERRRTPPVLSDTEPNFLVEPGQSFSPGSTSPTPLSPEVLHDLSNIFKALRTSYYAAVSFDFDHTQTHITPTSGIF